MKNYKWYIYIALLGFVFSACDKSDEYKDIVPESIDSVAVPEATYVSPLTKKIAEKSSLFNIFQEDTYTEVAPGVNQTSITYVNQSYKPMKVYILDADLSNTKLSIIALSPFNKMEYGKIQVISEMAMANSSASSKVLAAFNGDFFKYYNPGGFIPQSIFIKNGVTLKAEGFNSAAFFGMYKDGTPIIGGRNNTNGKVRQVNLANVQEAVGGFHWLVEGFNKVIQGDPAIEPRTAVGYVGKKIFFVVVDGRSSNYSNGINFLDLADLMVALGSDYAIGLDGGGSSTFVVKDAASDKWNVINRPSGGQQRAVVNGLAVTISE